MAGGPSASFDRLSAGASASPNLRFAVLGPLVVTGPRGPITLGGPKERAVLGQLLVRAGRVVSVDTLIDGLWGDDVPESAQSTLRSYVARLRRALEPPRSLGDGARVLVTEGTGYALRVDSESFDAVQFERLVARALTELEGGDAEEASATLRSALGLWQGDAYQDFVGYEFVSVEVTRLEELRVVAFESWVAAELDLGRHTALVGEIEGMLQSHPFRERLWAQLILCLYRSDRQADALRAYQRARAVLVEELGIEPGPELRHLEAAVLNQDPALANGSAQRRPVRALPAALNPGASSLIGRESEVAWLRAAWADARRGRGSYLSLLGPEGVGKTRLAAELAREVHDNGAFVLYGRCDHAQREPHVLFEQALQGAGLFPPDPSSPDHAVPGSFGASLARLLGPLGDEHGLLVVLDDLHVASAATLEILADLSGWCHDLPVLVVGTFRTDATPRRPNGDDLTPESRRAVLDGLDARGVAEICALYAERWTADELAALSKETAGNPLRVHERASEWARVRVRGTVDEAARSAAQAEATLEAARATVVEGVMGLQHLRAQRTLERGVLPTPAGHVADTTTICPYKALAQYDAGDADDFFGRESLVGVLIARMAGTRLVTVVGPSGSGKSSLLRAGLAPALARGSAPTDPNRVVRVMTPGAHPTHALDVIVSSQTLDGRGDSTVLIVDQFEETFTACHDEMERQRFIATLLDGEMTVVLGLRSDYVDQCATYPGFAAAIGGGSLLLEPMGPEDLRRAIELPARRGGLVLEPGLVDVVADEVAGRVGALPLLSTALAETWAMREGTTLTIAAYRASGGVGGAVARLAEGLYESLPGPQQAAVRRVFLHLSEPNPNGVRDVRRRVDRTELAPDTDHVTWAAVDALVRHRLLTADETRVELTHEALLRAWPRLRTWLDDDQHNHRFHRRLADAARAWDDGGRDSSELLRAARLAGAEEWADEHSDVMSDLERAYLEESRARTRRELDDALHARRRLRGLTVGLALLLVVAVLAASIVFLQRREALDQARVADATRLASQAQGLPADQLDVALLLAIEARHLDTTDVTDGALEAALARVPLGIERFIRIPGLAGLPAQSPDGTLVAGVTRDGTVIVDATTGEIRHRLAAGPSGRVNVARFSPDGRRVIAGSSDGHIRVFDPATGTRIGPPIRAGTGTVYGIFDRTDPTRLFTLSSTGVNVWDLGNPRAAERVGSRLPLPDGWDVERDLLIMSPSSDGRVIAVGNPAKNTTWVFDVASGIEREPVSGFGTAYLPGTSTMAMARGDHMAFVDLVTGSESRPPITGFTSAYPLASISPDGRYLAASDVGAHRIQVFDTATGQPVGASLDGFAEIPVPVTFLDARRLLVAGLELAARWRFAAPSPSLATPLARHQGTAIGTFTSNRAEIVTTGILDGRIQRWQARNGHRKGKAVGPMPDRNVAIPGSYPPNAGLGMSADGKTVATTEADKTVVLWDARSGNRIATLATGQLPFVTASWSPTEPLLVTGGCDGSVVVWDVSDRRQPRLRDRYQASPPANPGCSTGANIVWTVFSPDGNIVAATSTRPGFVMFIDLRARRVLRELALDRAFGAFSPDGRRFAVTSDRGTEGALSVVDVASGRVRTTRTLPVQPVGVAFVDHGRRIATSGSRVFDPTGQLPETTIALWDARSLRRIGQEITLPNRATSLSFASADGTRFASGEFWGSTSRTTTVLVWDLDPRRWEATACRIAGRSLTRSEWAQYLPNRHYETHCVQNRIAQ
jgi:DNA-binding SARP family transcriptional activator/WD40 repeat protein